MKSEQTIIRKNLMEYLNLITNLPRIEDKNIIILDYKKLAVDEKTSLSQIIQHLNQNIISAKGNHLNTTSRKEKEKLFPLWYDFSSPASINKEIRAHAFAIQKKLTKIMLFFFLVRVLLFFDCRYVFLLDKTLPNDFQSVGFFFQIHPDYPLTDVVHK